MTERECGELVDVRAVRILTLRTRLLLGSECSDAPCVLGLAVEFEPEATLEEAEGARAPAVVALEP